MLNFASNVPREVMDIGLLVALLATAGLFFVSARTPQKNKFQEEQPRNTPVTPKAPLHAKLFLVSAFLSFVLLLFYAASDTYTGAGINEATWYQLKFGAKGVSFEVLMPAIKRIIFIATSIFLLVWVLRRYIKKTPPPWLGVFCLLAVCANPGVAQTASAAFFFVRQPFYRDHLEKVIVSPEITQKSSPKSIIYVYAESFEDTWSTEFPEHTKEVTELSREGLVFKNVTQAPFTSWTIAGIIASQCGFPALGTSRTRLEVGSGRMMCLGDFLKREGYNLFYMNGADIRFAGKDLFFHEHEFNTVLGRDEILNELPKGTKTSAWGVYDDDLFFIAEQKIKELKKKNQPFFFSLLTVDTHGPDGYQNKFCKTLNIPQTDKKILASVHCSDALLARFVAKIKKDNPDVLVVLASDHLFGHYGFFKDEKSRRNRFVVFNSGHAPQEFSQKATTFDIAPTLLPLLGFTHRGFYLGRDIINDTTLVSSMGEEEFFSAVGSAFSRDEKGVSVQRFGSKKLETKKKEAK